MSRAKMVSFDDDFFKKIRKKNHRSTEETYENLARLCNRKVDTVKDWFIKGKMPEEKYLLISGWINGYIRLPKKKNTPERDNESTKQISFDEVPLNEEKNDVFITELLIQFVNDSFKAFVDNFTQLAEDLKTAYESKTTT